MKNNSPFFTIILPNWKTESFLEEALESIKLQTFKDFECLLVNDGSPGVTKTEDTQSLNSSDYDRKVKLNYKSPKKQCQEIFDKVVGGDNRFRLFHKDNGGQGSARNLGIDKSSGEFVIFLDCDDIFSSDHLESLYYQLQNYKSDWNNTVFLFDNVKEFWVKGGEKKFREKPYIEQKPKHPTFENYLVLNDAGITNCATNISVIQDSRFTWLTKSMEDVELVYRLFTRYQKNYKKLKFIRLDISSVYRRLHENSITYADSLAGFKKESIDKIKAYNNLLKNEKLTWRQKIICRLGIMRFSIDSSSVLGKFNKKVFTFISKIISGWYL